MKNFPLSFEEYAAGSWKTTALSDQASNLFWKLRDGMFRMAVNGEDFPIYVFAKIKKNAGKRLLAQPYYLLEVLKNLMNVLDDSFTIDEAIQFYNESLAIQNAPNDATGDDEYLSTRQALDALKAGKAILVKDYTDYSTDDENDDSSRAESFGPFEQDFTRRTWSEFRGMNDLDIMQDLRQYELIKLDTPISSLSTQKPTPDAADQDVPGDGDGLRVNDPDAVDQDAPKAYYGTIYLRVDQNTPISQDAPGDDGLRVDQDAPINQDAPGDGLRVDQPAPGDQDAPGAPRRMVVVCDTS